MRIVITGATGLLGRNLLFEILKQNIKNLNNLNNLEILILGRSYKDAPLGVRLEKIIKDDGYDYIDQNSKTREDLAKEALERIIPIPFDLVKDDLGISPNDFDILKGSKIDLFFHIAALTDFRSDNLTKARLEEVNVKGTQRILKLIESLDVDQIIYIGSAYSCGSKTGLVEPDYINLNETFRNPYEESKLRAEVFFREFAQRNKIKYKVFRPSTICGRLIEKPIGAINKFDVFYAWGAFFLRLKIKHFKTFNRIYEMSYLTPIRICFNPESGLNIVPVDYAAKVLYRAVLDNWKEKSFHLVNSKETPHELYVNLILKAINVVGYSFVANEPQDKNEIEKLYYKTVGKLFTPYAVTKSIEFDTSNIEKYLRSANLICPQIDMENLNRLIDFAKGKYFNLKIEN